MEITITKDMDVRVVTPRYALKREVKQFIEDKSEWIVKKLQEVQEDRERIQRRKYSHGHRFLFLGKKYKLEVIQASASKVRIFFDGLKWTVNIPLISQQEDLQPLVKDELIKWYRTQAKEIFGGRVFHYARNMGLEPQRIEVKTQKCIWGSCDHKAKTINLNWHLVLSPLNVIDYVIVHELCHLKVPNHSKRFWQRVEKVLPDYKQYQKWLRTNALDMTLP